MTYWDPSGYLMPIPDGVYVYKAVATVANAAGDVLLGHNKKKKQVSQSGLRVGVAKKMGFYVFLKSIGDHNQFSKLVNYLEHNTVIFKDFF